MTSLVLIRHLPVTASHRGRWIGGGSDVDADPETRAAAWEGMDALRGAWPPDVVLCSPLLRAQQTAAVADLPRRTDVRLTERDFGPWEGRPVDAVMADVPPEATADTASWLRHDTGGETFAEVAARVDALWDDVRAMQGCIWCVSHAGPLAVLRARALDIEVESAFDDPLPRGGWMVIDVDAGREVGRGRLIPESALAGGGA